LRIIVVAERERMAAIQPVKLSGSPLAIATDFDNVSLLHNDCCSPLLHGSSSDPFIRLLVNRL
jgi:hypothetical protein